MKKIIAALILFPLSFAFLFSSQAAEEANVESQTEVERARKDYLFQYANYTDAHKSYKTAKETYEKFGTIVSQQEAIAKAKQVLILRAEVLRTYLQLLKIKLNAQEQLDPTLRSSQFGKIEATQAFLTTHKENIEKTKSIFEVNAESQRLEREAEAIEGLSYESLAFILIGEAQELEFRTRAMLEDTIKQASEENLAIEQGASEAHRKLTDARVTIDKATNILLNSNANDLGKISRDYQNIQKEMSKTKSSIRQGAALIQEIQRSL